MARITNKQFKKYFGPDGKLKIIKQWTFNGRSYSARRDTDDYITIFDDYYYYEVGNIGYDWCVVESKIDALARRCGVMEPE